MILCLVLQIVPPVRPSLLDTALLLDDTVLDYTAQDTEGHSDTVVVVAVNAAAFLQLGNGLAVDLESIVEFLSLDSKFG